MDSSSTAPSSGRPVTSRTWCDSLGTCDAKRMVPSCGPAPLPVPCMVARDHGPIGSAAAFFRESMRRVAMIGMRTASALRI